MISAVSGVNYSNQAIKVKNNGSLNLILGHETDNRLCSDKFHKENIRNSPSFGNNKNEKLVNQLNKVLDAYKKAIGKYVPIGEIEDFSKIMENAIANNSTLLSDLKKMIEKL